MGGLRAEFFFTLIWGIATLQLMGFVGWMSGDRIRKGSVGTWLSETRFVHLQQIQDFLDQNNS